MGLLTENQCLLQDLHQRLQTIAEKISPENNLQQNELLDYRLLPALGKLQNHLEAFRNKTLSAEDFIEHLSRLLVSTNYLLMPEAERLEFCNNYLIEPYKFLLRYLEASKANALLAKLPAGLVSTPPFAAIPTVDVIQAHTDKLGHLQRQLTRFKPPNILRQLGRSLFGNAKKNTELTTTNLATLQTTVSDTLVVFKTMAIQASLHNSPADNTASSDKPLLSTQLADDFESKCTVLLKQVQDDNQDIDTQAGRDIINATSLQLHHIQARANYQRQCRNFLHSLKSSPTFTLSHYEDYGKLIQLRARLGKVPESKDDTVLLTVGKLLTHYEWVRRYNQTFASTLTPNQAVFDHLPSYEEVGRQLVLAKAANPSKPIVKHHWWNRLASFFLNRKKAAKTPQAERWQLLSAMATNLERAPLPVKTALGSSPPCSTAQLKQALQGQRSDVTFKSGQVPPTDARFTQLVDTLNTLKARGTVEAQVLGRLALYQYMKEFQSQSAALDSVALEALLCLCEPELLFIFQEFDGNEALRFFNSALEHTRTTKLIENRSAWHNFASQLHKKTQTGPLTTTQLECECEVPSGKHKTVLRLKASALLLLTLEPGYEEKNKAHHQVVKALMNALTATGKSPWQLASPEMLVDTPSLNNTVATTLTFDALLYQGKRIDLKHPALKVTLESSTTDEPVTTTITFEYNKEIVEQYLAESLLKELITTAMYIQKEDTPDLADVTSERLVPRPTTAQADRSHNQGAPIAAIKQAIDAYINTYSNPRNQEYRAIDSYGIRVAWTLYSTKLLDLCRNENITHLALVNSLAIAYQDFEKAVSNTYSIKIPEIQEAHYKPFETVFSAQGLADRETKTAIQAYNKQVNGHLKLPLLKLDKTTLDEKHFALTEYISLSTNKKNRKNYQSALEDLESLLTQCKDTLKNDLRKSQRRLSR